MRTYASNWRRGKIRTGLSIWLVAGICLAIGTSCQSPTRSTIREFVEKERWPRYPSVALEKMYIFQPDENGVATRFTALADRIDYCESYGVSVNEALHSQDPEH